MDKQRRRSPAHDALAGSGLARTLSKQGYCSRSVARDLILAGTVSVNGRIERDPLAAITARCRIEIDGRPLPAVAPCYIVLNKPRGLVTTTNDEKGRDTVYACLRDAALPWLSPVGRLDKASEGLLLFTNDTLWAAQVTAPSTGPLKTYHVQVNCLPDAELLGALRQGIETEEGTRLKVVAARVLRAGTRNGWLEVMLDEGRNRHLRRLLAALDVAVLRLVRVAVGQLQLGDLAKGAWRYLTPAEVQTLGAPRT